MPHQYLDVTLADDGTLLGKRAWREGAAPVSFQAPLSLMWIDVASETAAADDIWDLQDGYGEPGYTPDQGWDWSGIRDSTPEATVRMLAIARRAVPAEVLAQILGCDAEDLERIADARYPGSKP